ncbi:Hpt domain-containing protein [Marinobacter sp.]|uniref:Hpt domain-containing protein n=1 Tax=Marinobacter sp. TaxID=50741 RepID=UPI0035617A7D
MTDRQHLDEEALAELQDVMEDEFDVLIQTYIVDSRDRIASLKTALAASDADAFAKTAHSLKGSCINIGAPRLGELCLEAEEAGKAQDLGEASRLVGAIEEEFAAVTSLLDRLLVR